jgi:hypothetical protein
MCKNKKNWFTPTINPKTLFEKGASLIKFVISINKTGRFASTASSTDVSTDSKIRLPRKWLLKDTNNI